MTRTAQKYRQKHEELLKFTSENREGLAVAGRNPGQTSRQARKTNDKQGGEGEIMFYDIEVDNIVDKQTISDYLPDDWRDVMRKSTGLVYILQLEEGKYYVGWTDNLFGRMERHFSGHGAAWTKMYPPQRCLWLSKGDEVLETKVAAKCRKMWGEENVRGGPWKGDGVRLEMERVRQNR